MAEGMICRRFASLEKRIGIAKWRPGASAAGCLLDDLRLALHGFLDDQLLSLAGGSAAGHIPVATPHVITIFLRVFGINLLVGCRFVALANLCQAGNTSLGYPIVMYHAILYGMWTRGGSGG